MGIILTLLVIAGALCYISDTVQFLKQGEVNNAD